jgi:5-methylcytosine-specific restriction endonuclease McrA
VAKSKWKVIPKALKLLVINRNNLTCQNCGKKGIYTNHYGPRVIEKEKRKMWNWDGTEFYEQEIAFEFDHIIPRSRGGKTELKNLQLLCRECNRKKGAAWREGA